MNDERRSSVRTFNSSLIVQHSSFGSQRWPVNIAHRGAAADAPENTLAAFELALGQGADGIEFDVHLSACNGWTPGPGSIGAIRPEPAPVMWDARFRLSRRS